MAGVWMGRFGPHPEADDYGQYLMHAQALLEGRDYEDTEYLYSHYAWGVGPPVSAPGFSLSLVPVLATVGASDFVLAAGMLMGVLALVGLTALYFGRSDPLHGVAAAFLVGVSLAVTRGATTPYPDVPFAVLCWLVILLADGEERWTWTRTAAVGAFGAAAIVYRTAGIALIPSMVLLGLLSWKTLKLRPFLIGAAWVGVFWFVFFEFGAGQTPPLPADFDGGGGGGGERSILGRALRNALAYRHATFELQLYPSPWKIPNAGYHILATLVMLWGLLRWLTGSWRRFAAIFLLGYVGMLVTVPVQSSRYLWPLFPVLAYGFVRGLTELTARTGLARYSPAFRVMTLLGATSLAAFATLLTHPPEPGLLRRHSVQELFQHVERVRAQQPESRFAFMKARTMAWYTGAPTMWLFNPPSERVALRELDGQRITHLVYGNLGQNERIAGRWREIIDDRPDRFELTFRNDDFELYEVIPERR